MKVNLTGLVENLKKYDCNYCRFQRVCEHQCFWVAKALVEIDKALTLEEAAQGVLGFEKVT